MFDPQVITALACNLENKALAFRFLSDYFELLPQRRGRIIAAIHAHDEEAAMDAILSLKIASAMIGAHDTEDRCKVLQTLIARGSLESAGPEADALGHSVETLAAESPGILNSFRPRLLAS